MGLREEALLRTKFYVGSGWKIISETENIHRKTNKQTNKCMLKRKTQVSSITGT